MTITDRPFSPPGEAQRPAASGPAFDAAFADLLAEVRPGAAERERTRTLLFDEVAALRAIGFPGIRLPVADGGAGASFADVIGRLIDLSAADASLGHLYRGHVAFVEGLLFDRATDAAAGRPAPAHHARWLERIARGELVGNAQSERQEVGEITTRLERGDGGIRLSGRKYYTTGSIYADWIHLAALDGEERVGATVSAHAEGVRSVDDWDGFGQLLTGSGTTTFENVPVDPADIVRHGEEGLAPGRGHVVAAVFQLCLLAVVAGIARAALADAVDYVRPRRRIFGHAGETLPREDALTQSVIGAVSAAAHAAESLVLGEARALDAALDRVRAGTATEDELRDRMLDVFRVQQIVLPLVLDAVTELFEVGGASAVGRGLALDRHWRNVRTIASHNPAIQRRAALGGFELNGTLPEWRAPGARVGAVK